MVFFDSGDGLLVGAGDSYWSGVGVGGIYSTKSSVLSDSIKGIKDISFLNNNIGWLSAFDLYKTADAGKSWIKQLQGIPRIQQQGCSNPRSGYFSLTFADDTLGWAVSSLDYPSDGCTSLSKSVLYKTVDAGKNWSIIDSNFIAGNLCKHIKFINDSVGFILGFEDQRYWGTGNIFKTTDGGLNWQKTDSFNIPLNKMFFVNDSVGWVVGGYELLSEPNLSLTLQEGTNLIILKTTNTGESWEVQLFGDDKLVKLEKGTTVPGRQGGLSVRPNPFKLKTNITFKGGVVPTSLKIFDIKGRMVKNFSKVKSNSFSWNSL